MKAFVFINVRAGKSPEVVSKLRQIPGVRSANACWGRPDIIAVVEAQDGRVLNELVLREFQVIEGVEFTDTHIVIEEEW